MKTLLRKAIPAPLRPIRHFENVAMKGTGGRVAQGPFKTMRYINRSVGSALIPKLLGIYERELNGCIEAACAEKFPLIVDIGAAEGYYAVGLARRNPQARVIAFEMEEEGRDALKEMAGLNGVVVGEDRGQKPEGSVQRAEGSPSVSALPAPGSVLLNGKCEFANLQATLASAERSFVVCDVEGYEEVLLVPEKIPALGQATLLVETHDFISKGMTERIMERFAATHEIQRIWQEPRHRSDFPFRSWGTMVFPKRYLDWAVSEWRPERMCWLWLVPKKVS